MANFSLTYSPGTVKTWQDPATSLSNPYGGSLQIPSRLNARYGLPHRYVRFSLSDQIRVYLTPDGGPVAPPDSALGGDLFQAWFAEVPHGMHTWNSVAGQSATQWFDPTLVGAYCAVFSRPSGGGIIWHFMVD